MNVGHNTVVSLSYALYDADGQLIEQAKDPLVYLHGGYGGIFAAVEKALEGKAVGDECKIRLTPEDAFGEYDAELMRMEERDKFPAEVNIGMQFQGESGKPGESIVYTVTDIADGKVVVDGNHPLAGQTLLFTIDVAAVRAATAEELNHGHAHGPGGHHH